MSVSCVAVVWCVLSIIVAASFWFSLIQPRWFIHNDTMTSLGVYSYCYHDNAADDVITTAPPGGRPARHVATPGLPATERCQAYGGRRFHFSKLPSTFWQAACILLGSGSVLASVCALMAALTLCLPRRHDSLIAVVTGYVQIIAILLFSGGLAMYPVGLNSQFVKQVCGSSSRSYWPGDCTVGWTTVLAVISDSLAVFCPFLSRHVHTQLTRS